MRKFLILVSIFCALTMFGMTVSAQTLKADDELAVMKACQKWTTLQDDGNATAFLNLWTEKASFTNPFGKFDGKAAISQFTDGYISGFAKGKRHLITNLLVDGSGNKATATWDMFIIEVKEIPMIFATVRTNAELEKTSSGWKFSSVKLYVDDGFNKLIEKLQKGRE
jgi:ketosteroid isomerase-like protein